MTARRMDCTAGRSSPSSSRAARRCARCSAPTSPRCSATSARAPGDRVFAPVERLVYRVCGIDPTREQRWTTYALSLLAFSAVSVLVLYLLQRLQGVAAAQPDGMVGVPPALAFNTAVSFVTNTNWQNYAGESTMCHLTQMAGLAVQNFVSAAVGLAVAVALIRGLVRRRSATRSATSGSTSSAASSGSCCRSSFVVAIVFVSQGVVQNFHGDHDRHHGRGRRRRSIPGGPVASQEAIKELGTNGGGFFNANSAHPFENPNGFTNLLADRRCSCSSRSPSPTPSGGWPRTSKQGWVVFAAMFVLWIGRRR